MFDTVCLLTSDLTDCLFQAPVTVAVPAMELHYYTLNELSEALQDPSTNPALIPYLEHALNGMMSALFDGQQMVRI